MRYLFSKTFIAAFLTILALSQPSGAAAQNPSDTKPAAHREQAKAQTSTGSAPDGISKEQADAILGELRQIRQLLERQQTHFARGGGAQPSTPPPPEKVQMSVGDGWYSIGRADAPLTLVEFEDFQCPFCKRFHADSYAELKKSYIDTGKVRFVSLNLPLEFHPYAMKAAQAARCAGDQNNFWEYRSALYANGGAPNDDVLKKSAEGLSLDMKVFQSCLDSEKHKLGVQKDAEEAAKLQISGTPTFVLAKSAKDKLDGIRIVGTQPFATFQSAIDGLLKTE